MAPITLCSTGLSSAERRALEASIKKLSIAYDGNLTDRTTHLLANSVHPASEKIEAAQRLGLPIVMPSWVHVGAALGRLGPLTAEHVLSPAPANRAATKPLAERAASELNAPAPAPPEPLALLRSAVGRGELAALFGLSLDRVDPREDERHGTPAAAQGAQPSLTPPTSSPTAVTTAPAAADGGADGAPVAEPAPFAAATTVTLGGATYQLDAPTSFVRNAAVAEKLAAAGCGAGAVGSADAEPWRPGRPYTLRELLFALQCSAMGHGRYFLQCVASAVDPVLLLDKAKLLETVGGPFAPPEAAAAGTAAAAGRFFSTASPLPAEKLLAEGPLTRSTRHALRGCAPRHTPAPSHDAPGSADSPTGGGAAAAPPLRQPEAVPATAPIAPPQPPPPSADAVANGHGLAWHRTRTRGRSARRCSRYAELQRAAEERARLNATVSALSSQLVEERARAEAAAEGILATHGSLG